MAVSPDRSSEINGSAYHSPQVIGEYLLDTLTRMETAALLKYQPYFAGRDVLDIGVGAGRTSIYLAPLARRYEGIDFSPTLVNYLQKVMPTISTRLLDMRNMDCFPAESFDFVFASNNVLDDVGHAARLETISEVRRVLRPGGIFIFQAHNRAYKEAGELPRLVFVRNPITQLRIIVRWIRQLINHMKIGKFRETNRDFAILNDIGHDFSCLHYYIAPEIQRRQLLDNHFEVMEIVDKFGGQVKENENERESPALIYVGKRMG